MVGTSLLAEQLSASQGVLCTVEIACVQHGSRCVNCIRAMFAHLLQKPRELF
jgi:hypothetical protein